MKSKKEMLERLSNPADRFWVSNVIDKYNKSEKNWSVEFTDFLDPHQQTTVQQILPNLHISEYLFEGGYEGAERRVLIFDNTGYKNQDNNTTEQLPFEALSIVIAQSSTLSHRDYLGSLLGLGIQRDKVGDIIINENVANAILMKDIADFVFYNLDKIGRHKVKLSRIQLSELSLPDRKTKSISTTVSSLRLDSIIAAGFGLSRGDAVKYLTSERVTLNWKTVTKPDAQINEGDTVSVRGKGRLIIKDCGSITKKGRIHIELERPI